MSMSSSNMNQELRLFELLHAAEIYPAGSFKFKEQFNELKIINQNDKVNMPRKGKFTTQNLSTIMSL